LALAGEQTDKGVKPFKGLNMEKEISYIKLDEYIAKQVEWLLEATYLNSEKAMYYVQKRGDCFTATDGWQVATWLPDEEEETAELLALADGLYDFALYRDDEHRVILSIEKYAGDESFPDTDAALKSIRKPLVMEADDNLYAVARVNPHMLSAALKVYENTPVMILTRNYLHLKGQASNGWAELFMTLSTLEEKDDGSVIGPIHPATLKALR
jgi:hypothetical protein